MIGKPWPGGCGFFVYIYFLLDRYEKENAFASISSYSYFYNIRNRSCSS